MKIRIDTSESLKRVADHCHDAVFDTHEVTYDDEKMEFSITLTREMWEKAKQEKRILFLRRWKIPKVKSVLTFFDVTEAIVIPKDIQDFITDIDYDEETSAISFKCMIGTQITVKVGELNGKLEDIGEVFFDGTTFTSLGWDQKFDLVFSRIQEGCPCVCPHMLIESAELIPSGQREDLVHEVSRNDLYSWSGLGRINLNGLDAISLTPDAGPFACLRFCRKAQYDD